MQASIEVQTQAYQVTTEGVTLASTAWEGVVDHLGLRLVGRLVLMPMQHTTRPCSFDIHHTQRKGRRRPRWDRH